MPWPEAHETSSELADAAIDAVSPHGTFAVCFFLCIAAVCVFCSGKTLALISDMAMRVRYRRRYRVPGGVMVVAPLVAYILSFTIDAEHAIVIVESAGVLAFGAYWLVKTRKLARSNAELDVLTGKRDLPLAPTSLPEGEPPKPKDGLEPIV